MVVRWRGRQWLDGSLDAMRFTPQAPALCGEVARNHHGGWGSPGRGGSDKATEAGSVGDVPTMEVICGGRRRVLQLKEGEWEVRCWPIEEEPQRGWCSGGRTRA
jgi:LSD1 subclass zinc finger protein